MKIKLIAPAENQNSIFKNSKALRVPPISLAYIAALTPPNIEVSITDELVEPIDFDEKVDLIGITILTSTAKRGYQIADEFRKRGKKVVIGGVHATLVPEEAKIHADAVVIGEAEGCWENLIEDFKNKKMKGFYRRDKPHNLKNLPLPRRDLFKKENYLTLNLVETSRGCPFNCEFCCVPIVEGLKYRMRPLDEVIEEIAGLKGNEIFFTSNNLAGDLEYLKELCQRLISLRKRWVAQTNLSTIRDSEVLKLMRDSGCIGLFIGLESLSKENLEKMPKMSNLKISFFKDAVYKLSNYKIGIVGAFIFGFDGDDEAIFKKTLKFALESDISAAQFDILTPYPGTSLYKRLETENRLNSKRWWLEEKVYVPFQPKHTPEEKLVEGWLWVSSEFYKTKFILKRILKWKSSLNIMKLCLKFNFFYKKFYSEAKKFWKK